MIRRLKLAYKIFRKRRADARLQKAIDLIAKVPSGLGLLKIAHKCGYRIYVDTRLKGNQSGGISPGKRYLRLKNESLGKMINTLGHELRHSFQFLFALHLAYPKNPLATLVLYRAIEGDAYAFADALCAEITAATGVKTHSVFKKKNMRDTFYAFQESRFALNYDFDALSACHVVEPEKIGAIFNKKASFKELPDLTPILVPGLDPNAPSYLGHTDKGLKKALLSYSIEALRPYYQ